ncbi:bifunctional methylenetetrahydrofolate dehydrogenase/methenyltetrahydrofolate cyclohydrolase FolD [Amphritea sp. 2_MG-2023]|jgi:methylenetetrahydrofolate dehydrogenase (NADP+)/methenyltetrahydrofolate cyclohydrolase|uniref:bifunctional methylenetetrahydrofolate dehydrogenase/methenyltetrahydrofolate cyclohydrolase FolD n=1 Tax=Amphritea TaxID=515417 RepID=UPI001C069A36|nr:MULTISPECIES: bifunctional methylenetetrahydrofolate dehydrogenase/methenyltetrahydrofolate cyclohydrolase FolD [Amphritea]MBU2965526.1 bifunctional methylenetetrahydrofolate dehydrogenase/methenyltetrahydrofolate cyclohydrolase FolD [Amphritea atlantica]MDO6418681.1 bifunctional methylenetetrahydrofolate dehydrogenase/methenyltetrahydrofolate cyclohydrolase FolD [Amphritea sp. 2_MG-2023]MDX2421548.1 bifunctional methylenetetrahydrofolate dehydrogenase/methenyltetrahydrofolate cyclohydrolase 
MNRLIDGKKISAAVVEQLALDTREFIATSGVTPGLAVVLVGEDPASQVYVRNKVKQATAAGFNSTEHRLSADTTQADLNALVEQLNNDASVHGILVQLPLPAQLSEPEIIRLIAPHKDVDGFHPLNVGALASGGADLIPCTPMGCMIMLEQTLGDLTGKHAVVVGRSNIVGKPMAALLLQANCTVTIVHSRTQNIEALCREADILVAAVGRPEMIKGDWVKPGATVIDVGINAVEKEGKRRLVGDVDFSEAVNVAGAISPVPGGVGPMTIACLMKNTLTAARQQMSV